MGCMAITKLTIFNTSDKDLMLMQTSWASALNALLSKPITQSLILKNVPLVSGTNTINHTLGRKLVGWIVIRQRTTGSTYYDTQDTNPMPELTLQLVASGTMNVDLLVF
jgi:hypothetical protein